MKEQVQWSARELLMRKGFDDGMFVSRYELSSGSIVAPAACMGCSASGLGQGSFVAGDDYPGYVLCLVDLLRARGIQYIVLQDPEIGSHNVDTIQSFVWCDAMYVVRPRDCGWFDRLPEALQRIFAETEVTVQLDIDGKSEPG